jgi:Putative metal-binding motif/Secretion system C-terminal sorting domain
MGFASASAITSVNKGTFGDEVVQSFMSTVTSSFSLFRNLCFKTDAPTHEVAGFLTNPKNTIMEPFVTMHQAISLPQSSTQEGAKNQFTPMAMGQKWLMSSLTLLLLLIGGNSVWAQTGTTLYVDASKASNGVGTSWATAYKSLGDALAYAHANTTYKTIKVAAGTYLPTKKPFNSGIEMTTTDGRDLTFHIPDGVTIEGGYNASTGARDITANVTILSGDIGTASDSTDNAYHVVLASAASNSGVGVTIDGFTITGGNTNAANTAVTVNGNSIFRIYGGGISSYLGTNTMSNNTLYSNSGTIPSAGGGIYAFYGTNTLSNNTLYSNSSYSGGGIKLNHGTNTLSNNTLYSNSATGEGGGISTSNGTNTLSNNTLYSNSSGFWGGGISTSHGTNTLSNNTLYSNSATNNGGGIYTIQGTNTLTNNIFWQNKKGTDATVAGADYYAFGTNGNTFKNNLLQLASSNYSTSGSGTYDLGTDASANIFATDPLFVSTTDLRLQATSPCINAGITGVGIPTTDITGATRTGNPDLGAYEYIMACTTPTAYSVTGTGSYCTGGAGVAVGLANSETGVTYQLKNGATNVGPTINGNTGSAITFGNQMTAATYTVVATRTVGGCTANMTSSAVVNITAPISYYLDADGDTYGAGTATNACASPGAAYVTNATDCNDGNNAIKPSATEICNALDDNCNGIIDDVAAGTRTWTGTTNTNWDTNTNWNPACVPGAGDKVIIPNVTNKPKISSAALAKSVTVNTGSTLTIDTTGTLTINGSTFFEYYSCALCVAGTVQNYGTLTIGSTATSGTAGIDNRGTVNNKTTGQIHIDRTTSSGILNENDTEISVSGTFTNAGTLTIGANNTVGSYGINNEASFTNSATGVIHINKSSANGFLTLNGSTTVNSGSITIGAVTNVGQYALWNQGTFTNNACAQLTMTKPLNNYLTLTNNGLVNINTTSASLNNGTVTNNGIFADQQGNQISGTVTNNEIIAKPITGGCTISSALALGSPVNYTIGTTWYENADLTGVAGTYTQASNSLELSISPNNVATTLYFSVNDATGGCSRAVPIKVTSTCAVASCTTPNVLPVTGGGDYCVGGTGLSIFVSNTQSGVNYQLKKDNNNVGSALSGTAGLGIAFSNLTVAGTYTVVATTAVGACTANMSGSAIITIVTPTNYYVDTDGDTYGAGTATNSCAAIAGSVTNNTDCNDNNAAIKPGATEICDGTDNNCIGGIDDGLTFLDYYVDTDNDTYGAGTATNACAAIAGSVTNNTDCNNNNAAIKPGATEVCDGIDNNCTGGIDEGLTFLNYYVDTDNDTYGAGTATNACAAIVGSVTNNTDCNNNNAAIKPGATEVCDGIDNNCTGGIDEGLTFLNYYVDTDNDTYGAGTATNACAAIVGSVTNNTDCNNNNAAIKPGAIEICNGIDEDCDGTADDGLSYTPTFAPVSVCIGTTVSPLPTTSTNNITGTWSPALTQATATYLFTPAAGQCATTTPLTVNVNPLPMASISPAVAVIGCTIPSSTIALTAAGGTSASWSNNLGTALVANAPLGTFTVTVTNANGCTAVSSRTVTQGTLACAAPAINTIATVSGSDVTFNWTAGCYKFYRVQYRRTLPTAGPSWITQSVNVSTAVSMIVNVAQPGTYKWGLVGGCLSNNSVSSLAAGTNFVIAGTMMQSANDPTLSIQQVSLAPNPTKNWTEVRMKFENATVAIIRVMDLEGRVLFTDVSDLDAMNDSVRSINTEEMANGMYIVQVVTDGGYAPIRRQLLVQH